MDRRDYLFDPTIHADARVLGGLSAASALSATVARCGASTALVEGARGFTWRQIAEDSAALSAALAADGLRPGDVVGTHLPNGRAFVVAHLAAAALGAVTLPLHVGYGARDLADLLDATSARWIVVHDAPAAAKARAARQTALRIIAVADSIAGAEPFEDALARGRTVPAALSDVAPDDPLALVPTSGTESLRPKLCMHSHDGLLSNALEFVRISQTTAADRLLAASAYTHLFGLLAVHVSLLSGCALIAGPRFEARAYLELLREAEPTMLWAAPPALRDLIAADAQPRNRKRLREVRTAGTIAGAPLIAAARAHLADEVIVHWGMSEVGGGIATRTGERPEDRPGTIGSPIEGAEIKIVAAAGNVCGPRETGELYYRRADMLRGFYRNAEATNAALTRDGWLRTGDLASIDDCGRVVFAGRAKDVVDRGGVKIGALEIEAHVAAHPAVREVAVIAVADEHLGERAAAVVALHVERMLTLRELCDFLDARGIAKFKWPEFLYVVTELPKTATNKVAKSVVREMVSRLHAAETQVRA